MSHPEIMRYLAGMQARMDYYREIIAIRRMGLYDVSGDRICFAFGFGVEEDLSLGLFEIEIRKEAGELVLWIDAYSAAFPELLNTQEFDADQWSAQMIGICAPATRDGFRLLARIARRVINGETVLVADGSVSLDGFVSDTAEARP